MGPKYFTPKLLRGHFCRDFNIPRVKNVIVGTIYRQPDENVNDFMTFWIHCENYCPLLLERIRSVMSWAILI